MSSQSGPSPTIDVEVTAVEVTAAEVTEVVGCRVRSPWDVVWDGSEAQPLRLMKTIAVRTASRGGELWNMLSDVVMDDTIRYQGSRLR